MNVDRVVSVYKNRMTGHWMTDRFGTAEHPGPSDSRAGYRTWEGARDAADEIAEPYRRRKREREARGKEMAEYEEEWE